MNAIVRASRVVLNTAALAFAIGGGAHLLLGMPLRRGLFGGAWIGGLALALLAERRTAARAGSATGDAGRQQRGASPPAAAGLSVLSIGVSSFSRPLDGTTRKKLEGLARLAHLRVVGFSSSGRFDRFEELARFDLIPRARLAPVRFAALMAHALRTGWADAVRGDLKVVVCEDAYAGLAGLALRAAAGLHGRRVVVATEVHGDWEALFHYVDVPRWLRALVRAWARFVLRRSDLIRAASLHLEARVRQALAGRPMPVIVFPTYTDYELFLREDAAGSPRDDADETVVFVGALVAVKGIPVLIDAFANVRRRRPWARLLLVGEGPLRPEIAASVTARDLQGAVSLVGWLPQGELRTVLMAAKVLVLPSLSEGLGRVLVEALACGRPVVASSVGGIPELVRDGETGFLVPAAESGPLADRIVWLLEHPEEAARMGAAGRTWVRATFSTERYWAGYATVFEHARQLLTR